MGIMNITKYQSYQSIKDIYRNFKSINLKIEFEGHIYKYMKTTTKLFLTRFIYHCPEEQHILVISIKNNIKLIAVVDVQGIYCTEEALESVMSSL